jgi:hypothetical protein
VVRSGVLLFDHTRIVQLGGLLVWVFLAAGCFAAKAPDYPYWILLDFLGFSRPNLDFSMGYAAYTHYKIFVSSAMSFEAQRAGARGRGRAEAQDCS